ncbi:hypothetical protein [Aquirhabdus sp.]|uniref:hypothetical protein n=1 Tax=Aquirhabdus sp. TaxID=2824160 RepID=UPI00396C70AB
MKKSIFLMSLSLLMASCASQYSSHITGISDLTPPVDESDRVAKCKWIHQETIKQNNIASSNGSAYAGLTALAQTQTKNKIAALDAKATELGCKR